MGEGGSLVPTLSTRWATRGNSQIVPGVPYNILKFEVDGMNTCGDMAIQNIGHPPPHSPPGQREYSLKIFNAFFGLPMTF